MAHPGTSEPSVTVERDGHVLLIGLNRAHKRNAMDLRTIDDFAAAYRLLDEDDTLRVGVVFGHGDHFSAGLDLAEVGPAVAEHGPGALSGSSGVDPFGVWGRHVSKPVVLAVNGVAYTLSIELALASDIVIAADDVRFRQLEIGRGIMPFGGATFRAPEQLGWGNAMRFLLTGEEFGAAEALRIGLVQEVVPAGEHVARAREIAHVIAEQAPLGVMATLANARAGRDGGEAAATAHLQAVLPSILASEDAVEGINSFVERRPGRFVGR
ncbi:MAG: crotonase/enoyl-CoA hydratase family protein [bacterium]|nr:crotonase/enoyl-CoA hydratase family protein [bacterium]